MQRALKKIWALSFILGTLLLFSSCVGQENAETTVPVSDREESVIQETTDSATEASATTDQAEGQEEYTEATPISEDEKKLVINAICPLLDQIMNNYKAMLDVSDAESFHYTVADCTVERMLPQQESIYRESLDMDENDFFMAFNASLIFIPDDDTISLELAKASARPIYSHERTENVSPQAENVFVFSRVGYFAEKNGELYCEIGGTGF